VVSREQAYATCLRIARDHYENFPVASRLLPRALRPHIAAIYAFARTADDYADEPGRTTDERLALLEDWHAQLHQPPRTDIFIALHATREQFDLPIELFEDLLSAFRQDVVTARYDTWAQVLDYCRRSANPVGRLVLRLAGYRDVALDGHSDAVCTALQLTNFWQDLAIDWRRGRLYVPAEEWQARGADPADLDRDRLSPAWRETLANATSRTRDLFTAGRPIGDEVSGRLRLELRATWHGGMRILQRLEAAEFDVFRCRPTLGGADAIVVAWRTLIWPWHATPRSITRS
jgi:squalene synthase HpnC